MWLKDIVKKIVKLLVALYGLLLVGVGATLIKAVSIDEKNDIASRPTQPIEQWTTAQRLGGGAGGTVYSAIDRDGFLLSVKIAQKTRRRTHDHVLEADLLHAYPHAKIIEFYGTSENESEHCIFAEIMPTSLSSFLAHAEQGLTEKQAAFYIRQVLQAVAHLHSHSIIHRDIKGANILVGPGGIIKLADFGSAIKMIDLEDVTGYIGTLGYMAPEVRLLQRYGVAADIWSVGCTTLEILWGKFPYVNMSLFESTLHIQRGGKPSLPPNVSPSAKNFIETCLEDRAIDRPTASNLWAIPSLITKLLCFLLRILCSEFRSSFYILDILF